MSTRVEALKVEAQALPPVERAELIEALMESLDQTDLSVEAAWAAEAQDRLAALERGEVQLEDEPEILKTHRAIQAW